jgi:hypothetical protein
MPALIGTPGIPGLPASICLILLPWLLPDGSIIEKTPDESLVIGLDEPTRGSTLRHRRAIRPPPNIRVVGKADERWRLPSCPGRGLPDQSKTCDFSSVTPLTWWSEFQHQGEAEANHGQRPSDRRRSGS